MSGMPIPGGRKGGRKYQINKFQDPIYQERQKVIALQRTEQKIFLQANNPNYWRDGSEQIAYELS